MKFISNPELGEENVRGDLQSLYAGELNPVGHKAQKKVRFDLKNNNHEFPLIFIGEFQFIADQIFSRNVLRGDIESQFIFFLKVSFIYRLWNPALS